MNNEINCQNCGESNDANEQFCSSCGKKLEGQNPAAASVAAAQTNQPVPNMTLVATPSPSVNPFMTRQFIIKSLNISFELNPGETKTVGRIGSGADIEIDDDTVTSTPFSITMDDTGKMTVTDNGSSQGTRVVKTIRNDVSGKESIEVEASDMIVAGKGVMMEIK